MFPRASCPPPPLGCCAGRCFSRMLVISVDNIARSEQCHDKYNIIILAYSSFSILVIPLLPLNGCICILTVFYCCTLNPYM